MKKIIIGIVIGLLISTVVYALQASDILYKDNKTVNDALNELYSLNSTNTFELNIVESYDFSNNQGIKYISQNPNILSVDENNKAIVNEKGIALVKAYKEDKLIFQYKVNAKKNVFKITGAATCYADDERNCANTISSSNYSKIENVLTDNILTTQGNYGAILIRKESYIEFILADDVYISFSSTSYSDSGGSSGKTAYFYKINDDNSKTLHYTLQQLDDTNYYGKYKFEKGKYRLEASSRYVQFNEWTITDI